MSCHIGPKFPKFDAHPTPINVSIRPVAPGSASIRQPELAINNSGSGGATGTATGSGTSGVLRDRLIDEGNQDEQQPEGRESSSTCCGCVIS
jgi:hypothetical protein